MTMAMIDQPNAAALRRNKSHYPRHDDGEARHAGGRSKEDLDKELDKALEDSFPSSDPPSISQPKGTKPAEDHGDKDPRARRRRA